MANHWRLPQFVYPSYGYIPPEGYAYIKNYAENEGILEALIEAGALELTGEVVPVGPYGC